MIVTFISQCEKNALPKTRRVLDSFANRIGDNTWQTVITEEGLDAVKKLLRKTASKSTAVSCHWIRSRSRSEFLWAVGNRCKFNYQGIVPVNYTAKKLIKENEKIMIDKIYANTQKQPLDEHLFAIGYVAKTILNRLLDNNNAKLAYSAFVAGCFHDLGKLDPSFQKWLLGEIKDKIPSNEIAQPEDGFHIDKIVKKRFFDDHPRHNEISFLLMTLMYKDKSEDGLLNREQLKYIKHTVLWHHAKPIREETFKYESDIYKKFKKNLPNENFKEFFSQAISILNSVNCLSGQYSQDLNLPICIKKLDDDFEVDRKELPDYKIYDPTSSGDMSEIQKHVMENARTSLIRSAMVSADRIISSQSSDYLSSLIRDKKLENLAKEIDNEKSSLDDGIRSCLSGFNARYTGSQRNTAQAKVAKELAEVTGVAVLNGPAGCGKTKIALEWAVNRGAKKIIWVCPRVQVCQGIFTDLSSQEYLPNCKIEIYTGEFKQTVQSGEVKDTSESEAFNADIVITTIDQVVNSIITHAETSALIEYMAAHVVFDEFHEFINMPAFNLLFAELIACKKMRGQLANTLLVSATPNYYFLKSYLDIHRDDVKGMKSFNDSRFKISFNIYDDSAGMQSPLIENIQHDSTFVITNTATDAQRGFIKNMNNENAILFHSKFTKKDKQNIFDKVYECFKLDGNKLYEVLRSGPIVQASLNISCDKMLTEFTHAENWLQRLGRLDRFGKNQKVNEYITVLCKSIDLGKGQSSTARFLNGDNIFQSAKAWYEFLKKKEVENNEYTINEIYSFYEEFYNDNKYLSILAIDFMNALKKSIKVINDKILDPIRVPSRKLKTKDNKIKIRKQSLRGDSRFAQMAICNIASDGKYFFTNEYLFSENEELDSDLTVSIEEITGYGASDRNLLAYMKAKHHNIKDDAVKAYKDSQIIDAARSPENPIYLSYTPIDLEPIGGESQAHDYAIYYAICDKQAIGLINKINLGGN